MTKVLSPIIPRLNVAIGLELESLSPDPAVISAHSNDPLVHDRVSTRMRKGIIGTIDYIFDRGAEITLPLLIIHGTGDKITYMSGSEKNSRPGHRRLHS